MSNSWLDDSLESLESAEDFLDFFNVTYEREIVEVYRLHILQRFHDYMGQTKPGACDDESQVYSVMADNLRQAYEDFVISDAQTEKVFKVFNMGQNGVHEVPLSSLMH